MGSHSDVAGAVTDQDLFHKNNIDILSGGMDHEQYLHFRGLANRPDSAAGTGTH